MSDISPTEERLFALLDSIEQLAEQTKQLQSDAVQRNKDISQVCREIESREQAQAKRVDSLCDKVAGEVNKLILNGHHLQRQVLPVLRDETQKTIAHATVALLDKHMGDNIRDYDEQIKQTADRVSDSGKDIVRSAKQAKQTLDDTAEYYKEWFSWKVLALWGGATMLVLCFIIALYTFLLPSLSEIKERRADLKIIQEAIDKRNITWSSCNGQTCVKVDTTQCGYGPNKWNKDISYCVIK